MKKEYLTPEIDVYDYTDLEVAITTSGLTDGGGDSGDGEDIFA